LLAGCAANHAKPNNCALVALHTGLPRSALATSLGVKQGATVLEIRNLSDVWPDGQLVGGGLYEGFENMSVESLDSIILRLKDGIA
jgi:hypothetical protein